MATPAGLLTAGLAVALQKVILSFAGYLVILRGKTFSVGDRIAMGGVRGDVIRLGFFQTTIMEMGEPKRVADQAEPPTWVHARQYTGRVVTVTNDKVFENPVYNYSREFPFLFEELTFPIKYGADRRRVERILLDCVGVVTAPIRELSEEDRRRMHERYFLDLEELLPKVYYRLTDNWLELSVRFVARPHDARAVKDQISRAVLDRFEREGIEIASATFEVVGLPPLKLEAPRSSRPSAA